MGKINEKKEEAFLEQLPGPNGGEGSKTCAGGEMAWLIRKGGCGDACSWSA